MMKTAKTTLRSVLCAALFTLGTVSTLAWLIGFGSGLARVFHPDFGGNEQVFPRHAAMRDAAADFAFVQIGLRGVDMAVARFDGMDNGLFRVLRRGLVHAEAEQRDFYAVVEGEGMHKDSFAGKQKFQTANLTAKAAQSDRGRLKRSL